MIITIMALLFFLIYPDRRRLVIAAVPIQRAGPVSTIAAAAAAGAKCDRLPLNVKIVNQKIVAKHSFTPLY